MRKTIMLAATTALMLVNPNGAQAYDGPWCAVISFGRGGVSENCSMPSFEACRSYALSFGPTSFCRQNGYFRGYSAAPAPYRLKRTKRRHR